MEVVYLGLVAVLLAIISLTCAYASLAYVMDFGRTMNKALDAAAAAFLGVSSVLVGTGAIHLSAYVASLI